MIGALKSLGLLQRHKFGPIAPAKPVTAIADIHGCAALLDRALLLCQGQIICVGDYIDRGPDSAGVLSRLSARQDIICLMGNHEEMMLAFLDDPERTGARWLRAGGRATLKSFGIDPPHSTSAAALCELRDQLRQNMGLSIETWLRALPSFWQSGNLLVTHAGADPRRAPEAQSTHALRWGHPNFGQVPRRDGLWVLRGHVVYDDPLIEDRVICIDTGAWHTGRLTLALIDTDKIAFLEA